MIIKTSKNAFKIDGIIRSLLLTDENAIYASTQRNDYKPLLSYSTPVQAQYYYRGLLECLASDGIFCVGDDDMFCTIPSRQWTGAYVCFDGMLVRIDDVDRLGIATDDSKSVVVECPDGGFFRYDFATDEDATFAYNAIVEHIMASGVLLFEYRDGDLTTHQIK